MGCRTTARERNPSGFLCQSCKTSIQIHEWLFCPVCHQKVIGVLACQYHKYHTALSLLGIAAHYEHPLVKELLWAFKYESAEGIAEPLAELLVTYYDKAFRTTLANKHFTLVPLPLHARRERWRGFNQAMLLAQRFSEKTGLAVADVLIRTRYRQPQMELSLRKDRFENIRGVFKVKERADVAGQNFILIDDVVTSGATLEEAARVLKNAGAQRIIGFVVARG